MIEQKILEEYHCCSSLEEAKKYHGDNIYTEHIFYETFLKQTDYLVIKVAEGLIKKEDKAEVFAAREFAREQIRTIEKTLAKKG